MSINKEKLRIKDLWAKYWRSEITVEGGSTFVGKFLRKRRLKIVEQVLSSLSKGHSIIDLGCGGGTTLLLIKGLGFDNCVGIDFIEDSVGRCEDLGFVRDKDVFLMDAGDTNFPDLHFDVVFSEGLWEHFQNPEPFILEAVRIAKKYIVVVQPNHFSLFGRLMHFGWHLLGGGGVEEYSFRMSYFIDLLEKNGFHLVQTHSTILKEHVVLVFRRTHDE